METIYFKRTVLVDNLVIPQGHEMLLMEDGDYMFEYCTKKMEWVPTTASWFECGDDIYADEKLTEASANYFILQIKDHCNS